jgi:hypothetical protein
MLDAIRQPEAGSTQLYSGHRRNAFDHRGQSSVSATKPGSRDSTLLDAPTRLFGLPDEPISCSRSLPRRPRQRYDLGSQQARLPPLPRPARQRSRLTSPADASRNADHNNAAVPAHEWSGHANASPDSRSPTGGDTDHARTRRTDATATHRPYWFLDQPPSRDGV